MTLNEWEQSNIEVLTSREMGEWLSRRENRLLDKIRAEIDAQIDLHDTPFEIDDGMDSSFCDGLNKAKEIIDKYREEIRNEVN